MRLGDNLRIALRGLNANKLRSALTMLGVLIGVGAVIILIAVGTGSSNAVQAQINSLGTNTLTVFNRGSFGFGTTSGVTQTKPVVLTLSDLQQIQDRRLAPDVVSASPVISTSVTATYQTATASSVSVIGTTPHYLAADDYTVQAGSTLTSEEVTNAVQDVLIGQTVAQDLFGVGGDPLGATILLNGASFKVVGVLASKGTSGITNQDNVVIAPYTAVQNQLTGEASTFSQLLVQAKSSAAIPAAEAEVEQVLATSENTTVANLPFTVTSASQLLSTAQSTSSTFTTLLAAVAGISLLVGGIGVMNIMLVSVSERTREIGIRKAIGAPKGAILGQFLIEAVVLSLIGAVLGVVVGVVGSQFKITGVQPAIAPYSIFLAFGVAIGIGVFFGFYPANRAASLRPIEALRYE
ncbi:MAG: ABC transporter permease [Actinomycetota bacterium]|jgi:putative ABC transport system permease protein|nr:ABC transporter permease [Actinomycetota bacterium]